jgi:hypothetical protein
MDIIFVGFPPELAGWLVDLTEGLLPDARVSGMTSTLPAKNAVLANRRKYDLAFLHPSTKRMGVDVTEIADHTFDYDASMGWEADTQRTTRAIRNALTALPMHAPQKQITSGPPSGLRSGTRIALIGFHAPYALDMAQEVRDGVEGAAVASFATPQDAADHCKQHEMKFDFAVRYPAHAMGATRPDDYAHVEVDYSNEEGAFGGILNLNGVFARRVRDYLRTLPVRPRANPVGSTLAHAGHTLHIVK